MWSIGVYMDFQPIITYSKRKTLAIKITPHGTIQVSAPRLTPKWYINSFIKSRILWIEKHLKTIENHKLSNNQLTLNETQIKAHRAHAKQTIPEQVLKWSQIMGVTHTKTRISSAKTRWGSCSFTNTISINWRLILLPEQCLEYVIIHELAHITEKNHSKNFWNIVEKYCPDYKTTRKTLQSHQLILHSM
jgi:predicted metal-dependent hydrolase